MRFLKEPKRSIEIIKLKDKIFTGRKLNEIEIKKGVLK